MSRPFEIVLHTRVVIGAGTLNQLGELARLRAASRVLLVTDPGIVAAGHVDRAQGLLEAAGIEVTRFDEVRENPTTVDVDRCLEVAKACKPDLFIPVGGGSSLDTAKGADFLYTNGGRMEDYWGLGKAGKRLLPLIAVPTTAGTGSETQSYALIAREEDHQKMACGSPSAAPIASILDPELTATLPRQVAAYTGLDALTHSVEAAVSLKRGRISSIFAGKAFRLAERHLEGALAPTPSLEDREGMLVAATWAGLAIEHSMLGAAHACGNPLTAHFGLVHGHAVATMLPAVVRFNGEDPQAAEQYQRLALLANLCPADAPASVAVEALACRIEALLRTADAPSLAGSDVAGAAVPDLASEAARQWTAQFNPRPVGEAELSRLYLATLEAG
jgi:alcohol dehydrogenase class IV